MNKHVYSFSEGNKGMKALLGGKGANLAEMTNMGLPVPSGFTITTEACNKYFQDKNNIGIEIKEQIEVAIAELENRVGKNFNGSPCLLVSVRSGSEFSMPGMLDTILNLGLNDDNVKILGKSTNSLRFALDCYRRFIQMYSSVVLEVPMYHFETILEDQKEKNGLLSDQELDVEHLNVVIEDFKNTVMRHTGKEFEQSPKRQLFAAIEAVFKSWNNERARIYRTLNNISSKLGTAVNIQMMVFGNMGENSGTGVVFTRNPSTGENSLFGEFLMNAQGEDVVAGIRTPQPIQDLEKINSTNYKQLLASSRQLEIHYSDMQDIEFTIENGVFYILQTRDGKRSASAAVKIAVDFVDSGILSKKQAIRNFDLNQIDQLLHPEFDQDNLSKAQEITIGLPASPGAATGQIYFDTRSAEKAHQDGIEVILVRIETSPEDISGMLLSNGVLTARGGMTSHAAVVARGMGKCCISGCKDLIIDEANHTLKIGDFLLKEGDFISLDGSTGKVYHGKIEIKSSTVDEDFLRIMEWADSFSAIKVLANADTPFDASRAKELGGKGIGLCRTEHMFFNDRIIDIQQLIMSRNKAQRMAALAKLYQYQMADFKEIFKVMGEYPVNIRLLDPPLHEFLPKGKVEILEMATKLNLSFEIIEKNIEELKEVNPMMGLRGCRLGVMYPEIYEMQARAILHAASEVKREEGFVPRPEIMIPLVGNPHELSRLRELVEQVFIEHDKSIELDDIKIGTMIEVPRACLVADEIVEYADYFSFGTNDLTQMTLGLSRDDTNSLIQKYKEQDIYKSNPFEKIDQTGVGELMKMAIEKGRHVKPELIVGVCGEQAGDDESLMFLSMIGVNYVSCSPFRIPKARMSAGQAAIAKAENSSQVFQVNN